MQLKKWSEHFKRFISDEKGQSTTEYILILAVVVMIALKFKTKFGATMERATSTLDTKMNGMLDEQ